MTELLALRARDAAPSALYPVPGEVPNSILLAHADGVPSQFAAKRAMVVSVGASMFSRHRRVVPAESSLIVTDFRTALASSTYSPGQGTLVGHIRHSWLTQIAVCSAALRLTLVHPDGVALALVAHLDDREQAAAAASEVGRRACGHRAGRFSSGVAQGRWQVVLELAGAR